MITFETNRDAFLECVPIVIKLFFFLLSLRHYEYFMGCVKYNSLLHGVHCTFTQIDSIFGNQYNICPGE